MLEEKKALLAELYQSITTNKMEAITRVAKDRTRHLTIVLEDIRQSQNASAVIRSCDCFGIQDLHIIENEHRYKVNKKVVLGSSKWVDIYRYKSKIRNTNTCLSKLKENGYKIVATSPHEDDYPIHKLPLDHKVALVFGTENNGISEDVRAHADYYTYIPMFGFTESFNISVSVALCLNQLVTNLRMSNINWKLSPEEEVDLKLKWVKNILNKKGIYDSQIFD